MTHFDSEIVVNKYYLRCIFLKLSQLCSIKRNMVKGKSWHVISNGHCQTKPKKETRRRWCFTEKEKLKIKSENEFLIVSLSQKYNKDESGQRKNNKDFNTNNINNNNSTQKIKYSHNRINLDIDIWLGRQNKYLFWF